jgi:hypothetical protein
MVVAGKIELLLELRLNPRDPIFDARLVNVEDLVRRIDVTEKGRVVIHVLPVLRHELGLV